MELAMPESPPPPPRANSSRKRKSSPRSSSSPSNLGGLHDDMLERVLARLPPSSYSRLRAVCRRWRVAAASPTFLDACARVPSRDPWFLMLSSSERPDTVAFDAAEHTWTRTRRAAAPGSAVPVAASGGLVLYRTPATGALSVSNPLTGASRTLPSPPTPNHPQQLLAVAMYGGAHYRVALFTGNLPDDLSMAVFDSSNNSWESPVPLARRPDHPCRPDAPPGHAAGADDDDTVYFLSKSGDVVSTNMQRSASKQYSSVVVPSPSTGDAAAVAYFLSNSGTVVACDTARREFTELPRILPVYSEYSVDVVACGAAAYAVVLAEYLDTASLRVWEYAASAGEWRQVAAMPPAMSHGFRGRRADINCVGHGDRLLMVCVSSGDGDEAGGGCFMCDVATNRWEELPKHVNGEGEVSQFLAAFSFEPRVEVTV
ncbi:unnamed protein product [Urochloa humidicola]